MIILDKTVTIHPINKHPTAQRDVAESFFDMKQPPPAQLEALRSAYAAELVTLGPTCPACQKAALVRKYLPMVQNILLPAATSLNNSVDAITPTS